MYARTLLSAALLAAAAGTAVGQSEPSAGEKHAMVMVISVWDSDCSGSTRSNWDNMCDAWYDEIRDDGWPFGHSDRAWTGDGFYHNGPRVDSEFADCGDESWGDDCSNDHADEPDALMVGMHGSELGDSLQWSAKVMDDESGSGNCNAWQAHMDAGDLDAEFWHLSSCHSMDEDVWFGDDSWKQTMNDGVHQIDGFHGLMWIGSSRIDDYQDFADDAFSDAIADAWLDNMYIPDISGSDDQCPVTRGIGSSESNLWTRLDNEEYDSVYSDPSSITHHGVYYIAGCNPDSDPALPN